MTYPDHSTTLVDADALAAHLGDPGCIVVDCRFELVDANAGWQAYSRAHIPGAFYAHLDTDLSDMGKSGLGRHPLPDPGVFSAVMGRFGIGPKSRVVCYDDAGGALAAARAWWLMRTCGHASVAVLDGGWTSWCAAGLPTAADKPVLAHHMYPSRWDPTRFLLDAEVLSGGIEKRELLLIDARAAPRFRGEIEPIDPRAGHVPGAVNRPFSENLGVDGHFKSPEILRQEFIELLGNHRAEHVVHMCGSGVTAAHNLLAMEHAGLSGSHLYAPSWSGWIVNASRPVAIGG